MYRIPQNIRSAPGQDGAVVLDIREGQMFKLNVVGSKILQLLETGASEPLIVDAITGTFEVSREIADRDVRDFIESLKEHCLVENCGSNSTP